MFSVTAAASAGLAIAMVHRISSVQTSPAVRISILGNNGILYLCLIGICWLRSGCSCSIGDAEAIVGGSSGDGAYAVGYAKRRAAGRNGAVFRTS